MLNRELTAQENSDLLITLLRFLYILMMAMPTLSASKALCPVWASAPLAGEKRSP